MHLVRHRNRLTEYSVIVDIPGYPTRAMPVIRMVMHGAATVPLREPVSEVPPGVHDTVCFFWIDYAWYRALRNGMLVLPLPD